RHIAAQRRACRRSRSTGGGSHWPSLTRTYFTYLTRAGLVRPPRLRMTRRRWLSSRFFPGPPWERSRVVDAPEDIIRRELEVSVDEGTERCSGVCGGGLAFALLDHRLSVDERGDIEPERTELVPTEAALGREPVGHDMVIVALGAVV